MGGGGVKSDRYDSCNCMVCKIITCAHACTLIYMHMYVMKMCTKYEQIRNGQYKHETYMYMYMY